MAPARVDLIEAVTPEHRATIADIVREGIVGVSEAPDTDASSSSRE